ncbi:MlaD family protein [Mucilaginibacter sp. KACC 22063]|uniref:MlaD family protein n=1 Tax=Mucilaginibacter sp. KACC 22063 TaxID=3025666 RepID=UPI00236545D8|nr:MlaD family protein [Mucilaginibacter sp. KACC 22063]WDF54485.1 MlaD family protein [Mucilaginibacter sp. KACC 22063]
MDREENKKTIIVGIFIALGLVIFIVGVLTYGNQRKSFSNGVHISAVFNDVNGLMKGNNVWFSGVRVGMISNIKFVGISQVYVTMNIDKSAQQFIHSNAGARISSEGFIGNKLIVISGGTPQAPVIKDGDQLQVEQVMSTDDIMKTLQKNNQNLLAITTDFKTLSHKIIEGKGMVGQLMTDTVLSARFRAVIQNLDATTRNAARMAEQLNVYGAKLNSKDGFANKLATDTATFNHIQQAVAQLQKTTVTASEFAENLNRASNKLNSTDNALGVLLNDQKAAVKVQSTINYLQQSSVKLNDDLEAAQHNFLLKGFFKKRDKAKQDSIKEAEKQRKQ